MTKGDPIHYTADEKRPARRKSQTGVKAQAAAVLSNPAKGATSKSAAASEASPAKEKKGHSLQFRARPALRAQIDAAAETAGRSLSEEIEYRLAKSFEPAPGDRAAELLFGSRMNAHHLSMFAAVLESISDLARKVSGDPEDEWWESMLGRAGAAAAFNELTTVLIAPNDVVLTEEETETVGEIKLMAIARALRLAREADRRERARKHKAGHIDYATALGLMAEGEFTKAAKDE